MAQGSDSQDRKDYETRTKEQVEQYRTVEKMHATLSDIHNYWKQKHIVPVFRQVCDSANYLDFYAKNFIRGMNETGSRVISSLGSGDGNVEVQVAKLMKNKYQQSDFIVECVELSEFQLERAEKNAAKEGVAENIRLTQGDFNTWKPEAPRGAMMGHHALHHVLDLEHVFSTARAALAPHGKFLTADIIGRNGHMRWPETLEIIEAIWNFLPQDKKFHHIFKKFNEKYVNFDCSTQGFEGIRAQDILPTMLKNFEFEVFYAYGGITESFINRGFGANYDADKDEDRAFIDFLHLLNELLIDLGHVKPTVMFACASPEPTQPLRMYKNRTPAFCVRNTTV